MNGPNPVWTSARKKMNQSRPRRLCNVGAGWSVAGGCDCGDGAARRAAAAASRRAGAIRPTDLDSCTTRVILPVRVRDVSYQDARIKRHASSDVEASCSGMPIHDAALLSARNSMVILPGQQLAGRSENDDRLVFLIFWRGDHLLLGQLERDAVALVGDATKMQCIPIDSDHAAADAEDAAEIGYG